MKITQVKYEPVITEEKDWELPTEPKYYFETGIRRSISVTPVWTTWNKKQYGKDEEIYELDVVCIYQNFQAKIEKFSIQISRINDLYTREKNVESSIFKFLIDFADEEFERTKERFTTDFESCLRDIKEHLS